MNFETTEVDIKEETKKAYRYAIRLVSMRNYSYKKLLQKLIDKGYIKEISQLAINKLKDEGYYKEEYFINSYIRNLIKKGHSLERVRQFLSEEAIHLNINEITQKAFEINHQEYSESEQIEELILKKKSLLNKWSALQKEEQYKAEQKLLRFLVAKGHQFGPCLSAIKKYIKANLTAEDSY